MIRIPTSAIRRSLRASCLRPRLYSQNESVKPADPKIRIGEKLSDAETLKKDHFPSGLASDILRKEFGGESTSFSQQVSNTISSQQESQKTSSSSQTGEVDPDVPSPPGVIPKKYRKKSGAKEDNRMRNAAMLLGGVSVVGTVVGFIYYGVL